jgi:hypothetical protein
MGLWETTYLQGSHRQRAVRRLAARVALADQSLKVSPASMKILH